MERTLDRAGGRGQDRRDRVQARAVLFESCVCSEELEVRHLADAPTILDLVDQLERSPHERSFEILEDRRLGLPPPDGEVAVDARVRLRRAPVELDQPVDRAVEVARVEAVERLDRHRSDGEHLAREAHEERPVAQLGERVRDRQVGDCGREEHRPVGFLAPEEAEDVRCALGVGEVADEARDALALAAVELADVERAPAADKDAARREVVRPEVDEGADCPPLADARRDRGLVDAVLQREDEAVTRESRRDRIEGCFGVLRLHREEDGVQPVRQLVGRDRLRVRGELLDRPFDRQALLVDRGNMLGVRVAEQDVVPVACEPRSDRAADRTRAHDHVLHSVTLRRRDRPHAMGLWTSDTGDASRTAGRG